MAYRNKVYVAFDGDKGIGLFPDAWIKFLLFLVFVISSLSCTAQPSRTVYVSSSQGNDSNTGLTSADPLAQISKALTLADTVCLKAGDTFYGSVDFTGKYVTRYGKGEDPVVCGFRQIVSPRWVQVDENIWKISLKEDCYAGVSGNDYRLNNVGCIYDYEQDAVHGHKVRYEKDLSEDWDFWQTSSYSKEDVRSDSFDWLYLYLGRNPNLLNLGFSVGVNGVKLSNGKINHIQVKGFGRHGIAAGSNAEIIHCRIDAIGGSIQIGYKNFVRLGNGIEFYVSEDIANSLVEHCEISRCYDCGITIQGSGRQHAAPSDITIRRNYIHDCCQGWEDFLRNGENDNFNNCVFSENLLVGNGNRSAFGYDKERFKFCHVLGNNLTGNRGMIIQNNVFIDGNFYCSGAWQGRYASNVWTGNVCYIRKGQFLLGNYTGTKDVIRIPADKGSFSSEGEATEAAISQYRELTGDGTTTFVVVDEKKMESIKKKYLKRLKK